MTTVTEGRHAGEFLLSEANFHRSRENATIAFSQTLLDGTVLGRIAAVSGVVASAAADAGNTGNGVMTLANRAISSKVKDGVYDVVCTATAANGGTFDVTDPTGRSIGKATVGVAFNKEVKFTIADGATDFVVGDRFAVTVAVDAEDFQYVAYNPAGADGSEVAVAIAIYGVVTPADATAAIAIIARDAEVNGHQIEWPAGITAAAKADAVQALEARGIIIRN
ncbi:MAG: head decoration protein [Mesorhizobium sp.]|uniref:head decoration protein n=1 Tax=Mesorhizobium sp. TaxID=1871066 RepID=UPI0012042EB3|nr:head decoration protein [Mesorhizobium sp.]TIQ18900.1 MAG: head decoration protein [Mesorhizobium sp.]